MDVKRKFTVEELDSFTEEELSMYDSDEPQPGMPAVWLIGIESTDRDFARYEAWRRRNDLDKMTNFDYDAFLEAEAEKEAAAKRSPFVHRQTSAPKTIDDWLRVLPDMRPAGRNAWHGPCPLCGEGDDRFNIKEGETAEVLVLCRECQRQGISHFDFYKQLCDMFFPREIPMSKPARSKIVPLKPEMPKEPESGEVTLPFKIKGNGNINLKQPVAEDIRQLLQHMGLETRWNTRANRVELKGEGDWFNYGDYDSALHNALENIWYGVEDKEKEKVIYKPRSFSDTRLLRSLTGIAQENKVDPFLEYLEALPEPTTPTADREALAMRFIHGVWGVKEGYRELAAYGFRNLLRAIVHRTIEVDVTAAEQRVVMGADHPLQALGLRLGVVELGREGRPLLT